MFYKKWPSYLILSVGILLSGCASMFSGSNQAITIKVVDDAGHLLEGVQCALHNSSGESYFISSNPKQLVVKRDSGIFSVDCKKSGYKKVNVMVGDSFNKVTLLNVFFWPGFLVDAATGSYKKYPSHYVVVMERADGSAK